MSQQNLELVVRVERAMASGDMKSAFAEIDPELTLREPSSLPWGGTHHGHQGMLDALQKLPLYWDFVGRPVMESRDAGDLIVVRMRIPARSKKTGVLMDLELLELHKVVDGKIKAIEIYWFDTAEYLKQM